MTDADYPLFDRAFRRAITAFRVRLKPDEAEDLTRTYFRVLEAYPLDEVLLAGKACLAKHRHFPKAADWMAEVADRHVSTGPSDCRWMSVTEADELARATALRYEDHPCLCSECCRAGVDHRLLRYVPTLLLIDEVERAFNPQRNVLEVVGHWAHGEELRRWYEARDAFYALKVNQRFMRLALAAAAEREPGEEG